MSRVVLGTGVVVATLVGTVMAHHSPAAFDRTKKVELKGTVTAFKWSNPHTYLEVDVPGKKGVENWVVDDEPHVPDHRRVEEQLGEERRQGVGRLQSAERGRSEGVHLPRDHVGGRADAHREPAAARRQHLHECEMSGHVTALVLGVVLMASCACRASAPAEPAAQAPAAEAGQPRGTLSALAPANLKKSRPAPPFDLTGNWFIDTEDGRHMENWRFGPPYPPLKPDAQKHFDFSAKHATEGKVYKDDIAECYPAVLPLIMTRYWPMAMIQLPTAIYMVSGFMNSFRTVFDRWARKSPPTRIWPSARPTDSPGRGRTGPSLS